MNCQGWDIYFHRLFQEALNDLIRQVSEERDKDPINYRNKEETKLLAKVFSLIKMEIPQNPCHPKYFLGKSLGPNYGDWRRAKPSQQYRLFFKFSSQEKKIIYAWLNDISTLRKYGSRSDAYKIFAAHLKTKKIPNGFHDLQTDSVEYTGA